MYGFHFLHKRYTHLESIQDFLSINDADDNHKKSSNVLNIAKKF